MERIGPKVRDENEMISDYQTLDYPTLVTQLLKSGVADFAAAKPLEPRCDSALLRAGSKLASSTHSTCLLIVRC